MSESLLRRGRGRNAARRRAATLGCVVALAGVGSAVAGGAAPALQPDPAATPASASLKPDAFGGAGGSAEQQAVPAPHPAQPARATEGLPVTPAPAAIPAPALRPASAAPPPSPPPQQQAPTRGRPISTHASLPAAKAVHVRPHRSTPRARIPRAARGSAPLPLELRLRIAAVPKAAHGSARLPGALRPAVATPVSARGRDVIPAALGLLLLVAVSGCFLAVTAALLREEAA
jgi:hypothetical protein